MQARRSFSALNLNAPKFAAKTRTTAAPQDSPKMPGHAIRRLQQVAVAVFASHTRAHGITPVQYAAMHAIAAQPLLDQRTLAKSIRFDTSTIGGVIDRLETRGFVMRSAAPGDRRVRLLSLTAAGQAALRALRPDVVAAQKSILAPLSAKERKLFSHLIEKLLSAHEADLDGTAS